MTTRSPLVDWLKPWYHRSKALRSGLKPLAAWRNARFERVRLSGMQACQRLADLATGDITVRVDEFHGEFRLGASSHLLWRLLLEGHYEPRLAALACEQTAADRDVLDIGANVGFFSVLLAKRLQQGRLLAAEPSRSARERLQHNIAGNCVGSRVIVFAGMVGREDGQHEFSVIEGMEEYSSAIPIEHAVLRDRALQTRTETVPVATVDSLVAQHHLRPGFIKIDVEGFEMEVLHGAQRTLSAERPVILSELSQALLRKAGTSSQAVVSFLHRLDYDVIDPLFPDVPPGRREYGDILATPRR